MLRKLWNDETGFIVSAELILIATLLVIGLITGLSEIQHAVVSELNDVSEAIGCLNQSYVFTGFTKFKTIGGGVAAATAGGFFIDRLDDCDKNECSLACAPPRNERPKNNGN